MVGDDDRTAWAIPYTDLTMLLLVFFVIMVSLAEPSKSGTDTETGQGAWRESARILDLRRFSEPAVNPLMRRLDGIAASARGFLDRRGLGGSVQIEQSGQAVRLRMPGHALFASGAADLGPGGRRLIARLAEMLRGIDGTIRVGGHTDDRPIETARYPSNWELSAARAIAVVRYLRDRGLDEARMEAIGYGANRPIASNATAEGRARNRRVTIAVAPEITDEQIR